MLTSNKLAISRSSSTDQRRGGGGGGGHQQELYSDNNNDKIKKKKKKKNMGMSSELQVSSSFNDNNNNDRRSSGIRSCVVNVVGFGEEEEEEEEEDSSELNLGLSLNSMITKNRNSLMGLRNDHHHHHHPIEDHDDDDDHNNNDDDDQFEMRSEILEKRSEMSSRRNRSSTRVGRILTARDFPCLIPSMGGGGSGGGGFSAGKIREDDVAGGGGDSPQEVNSGTSNQVVGWPPIGAYRMNSLANTQSKNTVEENSGKNRKNHVVEIPKITVQEDDESQAQSRSMFVKVNMDGVPIGRKVDLSNHVSYQTLALALEDMFKLPSIKREHGMRGERRRLSLLNGNSEYALTYEDREGDWMLVGDVPWRMFFTSVRRLRIMKTSEASGLGR